MAYTNFQHCTANEYKNIIYNQETHNKIKILFNNVELEDADEYCESFEVTSRVIPNGSKVFMLENLVSQEATLVLHNIDTSIIQDQVSISIGTLVSENTYEYVPIGIYNLQEIPTTDNGKTTIKLRDNSVKLDFNYNAKPLIDEHGGTATKLQILQDICSQANITCNVLSFIGSSDLIGIYDNTITGRQYVSYLAGSAGAIPIITRSGALDFKYLNNLSIIQIPIEIVERYSNAENFKVSRVVYEDAIRKYESGNETYDTLFLDSANPYISSQQQVASIYNIVNNFEINSFTTGRILGNPAIDSYDLIQITDYDGTIFKTFANNTLRYNGKMINTFASEISFERKKENVSLKSGAAFKKWAKTEIDNANAQITMQAGQIEEIEQDLQNPTSTKEGKYFNLEDALDSPLIDFSLYGQTQREENPTPSSPQEIHNVSGDNTIEICGKNLFDKDSEDVGYVYSSTGSYSVSALWNTSNWIAVESSTKYVRGSKTTGTTNFLISEFDKNKTFIKRTNNTSLTNTFTTDSTTKYIRISYKNDIGIYEIQLEKGSTATEYEPYQGNSQLISLGVENLLNLTDRTTTLNGITATITNNEIVLNGTASAYTEIYVSLTAKTLSTGNYTLSINEISGSVSGNSGGNTLYNTLRTSSYTAINQIAYGVSTSNTRNFTSETTLGDLRISLSSGVKCTNYTYKLQLEKGTKANSYSEYGKPYIELNKIGTYQDYIYKEEDRWFHHKEIGKVVLDGSDSNNWNYVNTCLQSKNEYPIGVAYPSNDKLGLSNYFICKYYASGITTNLLNGEFGWNSGKCLTLKLGNKSSKQDYLDWLSTHNTIVNYVLATPTDTEITDTTLLEQLNRLMTLPLYKNMTHITLTPNDLQPTMKIEYYRDTSINENFVSKEDMTKYYTKKETDAQILINSSSIQQSVSELQETTNGNTGAITSLSNQVNTLQTSTSLQINAINEQLEDGVSKVKTTTGYTLDGNGLSITKGQGFSSLTTDRYQKIEYNNKELSFMGYDDTLNKPISRIEELEARKITTGVHRTETIQEDGEKWTAQYYVGGGN